MQTNFFSVVSQRASIWLIDEGDLALSVQRTALRKCACSTMQAQNRRGKGRRCLHFIIASAHMIEWHRHNHYAAAVFVCLLRASFSPMLESP
jgi:hypothetical protein